MRARAPTAGTGGCPTRRCASRGGRAQTPQVAGSLLPARRRIGLRTSRLSLSIGSTAPLGPDQETRSSRRGGRCFPSPATRVIPPCPSLPQPCAICLSGGRHFGNQTGTTQPDLGRSRTIVTPRFSSSSGGVGAPRSAQIGATVYKLSTARLAHPEHADRLRQGVTRARVHHGYGRHLRPLAADRRQAVRRCAGRQEERRPFIGL
jgi:hypothetical protein